MVFDVDGIEVEVQLSGPTRGVLWCSHWELIDRMVELGFLVRRCYGPAFYGHCDYFIVSEVPSA